MISSYLLYHPIKHLHYLIHGSILLWGWLPYECGRGSIIHYNLHHPTPTEITARFQLLTKYSGGSNPRWKVLRLLGPGPLLPRYYIILITSLTTVYFGGPGYISQQWSKFHKLGGNDKNFSVVATRYSTIRLFRFVGGTVYGDLLHANSSFRSQTAGRGCMSWCITIIRLRQADVEKKYKPRNTLSSWYC